MTRKEEEKLINKVESYLSSNYSINLDKQIAHNVVSLVRQPIYDDKYYNDFSIQFILTKENEKIFNYCLDACQVIVKLFSAPILNSAIIKMKK